MSGGVDSSTAAWLLREQGHDIAGFTMRHRGGEADDRAIQAARSAADVLGIPHHVVELQDTFRETVIDYFCDAYFDGLTPNPCVLCNAKIKFGALLNAAIEAGMDLMATGHYVRNDMDAATGLHVLRKARDAQKDQAYFLYRLTQEQLARAVFPNGDYTKSEIREFARKAGLPAADSGESQEVCFVPRADYAKYLSAQRPERVRQGRILDRHGNLLGWHEGIHLFTVGQRRGLGVAAEAPLYVLQIQPEDNAVVVAGDDALFASELITEDNVFTSGGPPPAPDKTVHVKIRYNSPPAPARLDVLDSGRIRVQFESPQRAITPGQSAVFYSGDKLLGGGIIARSL